MVIWCVEWILLSTVNPQVIKKIYSCPSQVSTQQHKYHNNTAAASKPSKLCNNKNRTGKPISTFKWMQIQVMLLLHQSQQQILDSFHIPEKKLSCNTDHVYSSYFGNKNTESRVNTGVPNDSNKNPVPLSSVWVNVLPLCMFAPRINGTEPH